MKQNVDMRRISGVLRKDDAQNSEKHGSCAEEYTCKTLFAFFHLHWNINQTLQAWLTFRDSLKQSFSLVFYPIRLQLCTLTGRNQLCCWSQHSLRPVSSMMEIRSPTKGHGILCSHSPKGVTCKGGLFCLLKQYNCHLLMSSTSLGYLRFKPTFQLLTHPHLTCK